MLKERVKALRKLKGWTQKELAKEARVSQQAIWKIESGKAAESRKLPQIADALGVQVEELTQSAILAPVKETASHPERQIDTALKRLTDLWPRFDKAAKKHVLRTAEGELARIAQRPFKKTGARLKEERRRTA